MARYAQHERRALADLLARVGPDAPTLCEGWTTADLAAHLVLRERRPDAALGIVVAPLAGYTAGVQRSLRDRREWPDLVAAVRDGPPFPLRFRVIDEPMNSVEYFVHHEDVRRAQPAWEPRDVDAGMERALWSRVKLLAKGARRKAPVGLVLEAPGHGRVTVRPGPPAVTVTGPPGELALFVFGRSPAVRLEMTGDEAAVRELEGARFGF